MPVKNASQWVEETILSIRQQSFENWELICIDDYSLDDSFTKIGNLSLIDNRIKIVRNSQPGIIPALQKGLELSKGKYITRMDADDLMPIHRLEHFHNAIQGKPKTVVTGKVEYFSHGAVSSGYLKYESWLNHIVESNRFYDNIFRECIVASPNWMCSRQDLIDYDIFHEMEYPEDYSICFLWMRNHFKIIGLNEVTLLWRDHPERTSRNSSVYDQESFFKLKLDWFARSIPKINQSIGILGAQKKGKLTVDILQHYGVRGLNLYDYQSERFNTPIKGLEVNSYKKINDELLLIAIYPNDIDELSNYLFEKGYVIGKNAWYL